MDAKNPKKDTSATGEKGSDPLPDPVGSKPEQGEGDAAVSGSETSGESGEAAMRRDARARAWR